MGSRLLLSDIFESPPPRPPGPNCDSSRQGAEFMEVSAVAPKKVIFLSSLLSLPQVFLKHFIEQGDARHRITSGPRHGCLSPHGSSRAPAANLSDALPRPPGPECLCG